MFHQGNQVATESQFQSRNNDEIWDKLDPDTENETKNIVDEKIETNIMNDISEELVIININFYINLVKNILQHKKLYSILFHGNSMLLLLIINNFSNNLKHIFQYYLSIKNC
ncbi:hypothetical protein RFI_33079 [Reticulomyxa filosa]|uniref:Uncharacterized protein n=1 Tax=Reticulomyxa filosa TaxID=46433 RepID=X6LRR5_RETFI|nr:hypothetical protein RFI_33079 [Reticulomyxa filosa]|eukprot:ETO04319.1 hypothetical protein RFI_33079 [Reticulomyxa filosa]